MLSTGHPGNPNGSAMKFPMDEDQSFSPELFRVAEAVNTVKAATSPSKGNFFLALGLVASCVEK